MPTRLGGSDCLTVGQSSCTQLIFLVFFLFVVGRQAGFRHKQGELEVETVKATTDSERRKSRRSSTTSGCTLELRNVCLKASCPCVTLSRKQQELDAKEPDEQPSKELCVAAATPRTQTLAKGSLSHTGSTCPSKRFHRGGEEGSAAIGSPQEKGD